MLVVDRPARFLTAEQVAVQAALHPQWARPRNLWSGESLARGARCRQRSWLAPRFLRRPPDRAARRRSCAADWACAQNRGSRAESAEARDRRAETLGAAHGKFPSRYRTTGIPRRGPE